MPIKVHTPNLDLTDLNKRLTDDELILNALKNSVQFKGEYATYNEMTSYFDSSTTDRTPQNSYWVFITNDLNYSNTRTQYFYNDEWIYGGNATSVNDSALTTKGVIALNGDLENIGGSADYPQLRNVLALAGTYNVAGNIMTYDNKGRLISISISQTNVWEFNSIANSRASIINTITVPKYEASSEILVFWNGNLLNLGRDYLRIDSTTIKFNFDIRIEDDLYIKNMRYTGIMDKSMIINDLVASNTTTYSSDKTDGRYCKKDSDIISGQDNIYSIGDASHRYKNIYVASGVISTSDEKLKTDIEPSDLGLDFILKLNAVKYRYKDGKRIHYGMLSNQVKEVLGDKDFGGYVYDPIADLNLLRYEEFINPLISSVQTLSSQNDLLKARLDYLELSVWKKFKLWVSKKLNKNK